MITKAPTNRRPVFLSEPAPVNMGSEWFDIVDASHFWIRNRLQVFLKMAPPLPAEAKYAEIGCGTGLFQDQLERNAGISVDGFDLNLEALKRNISRSPLFVYNVFEQCPSLESVYDGLFLFDVLEHLDDDREFVKACLYHLKPGGLIYINVPSREELRSKYDALVGHVRRYSLSDLVSVAESCGLAVEKQTYWGMPFYPLLAFRKLMMRNTPDCKVLQAGMKPPSEFANRVLASLSLLERIPQSIIGTSAMLIARKPVND